MSWFRSTRQYWAQGTQTSLDLINYYYAVQRHPSYQCIISTMSPENIYDCSMDMVPPACEDVWGATGVWFNGKSITQHGTAKGALNSLLLPIFALNSARQAANEIQRNTDATGCSTSGIQLPLINAASLSQRAKSALERAARLGKTSSALERALLSQPTSSSAFQMSALAQFWVEDIISS